MNPRTATRAAPLDLDLIRAQVAELAAIDRPTATPGELTAAQWVAEALGEIGIEARLEREDSNGGYWWPLGLAAAAGVLAGGLALCNRRLAGSLLGAAACAAAIDDLPPRSRRFRNLLPKRDAYNVVGELGPADAPRTVVVCAHHDAAHSGLVFHPALPEIADRLGFIDSTDTSPPLMWPVVGASGLAGAGALTGSRALARAGVGLSAGVVAAMADIGSRSAVPGANDNATGVAAMLAIARALAERPVDGLRVMFLSTSEEATCEGMHRFAARHFDSLPVDRTFFLCLDTVGSPRLCVLRGEGMFGVTEYPEEALDLVDGLAAELAIDLYPNLRLRNATDGVYPLNAGYPCVAICSVTDLKQPANYHWPTDVPENVDYSTVADAVRLAEATIRSLAERWV